MITANGHRLAELAPTQVLPLYSVRGQVSHIPSSPALGQLKQVLCYDGYLTPVNANNGQHCIGASYQRGDTATDYREQEQQENCERSLRCLPEQARHSRWTSALIRRAAACAAPPAIICRWSARCRTIRPR